jgi:uncharacterized protein YidB (DUF937 family)
MQIGAAGSPSSMVAIVTLVLSGAIAPLQAASPYIRLGPADELALDQPRVAVEVIDPLSGRSLGPELANTFLLDTGANSILVVDDAIYSLNANGYQTEGTFFERGIGGTVEFDVSAEYDIRYAGTDGQIETLERARILSSTTTSFCPIPGLCSFFGIIGMPAMENRITTLNLASLEGDGGELSIDDLLTGDFGIGFLETTFSDHLPSTALRRFRVPISALHFPAEGAGPLPNWSDLPSVRLTARHAEQQQAGNFVLDTGAQMSLLSPGMAFDLGLDANGNGTLDDEAIAFQEIGGIGGTTSAPILWFDELRLPTREGAEMIFENVQVAVVDIDPTIDGIFGMNMLSSGWSGSIFGGLGDLLDLLEEAGLGDLLDELGGIGLGGEGAPFGYFEQVHFDFRDWSSGQGDLVFDLMPEVSGLMAFDGTHGDLDQDGDVDLDDRFRWVHDIEETHFGDSTLDGVFDSRDLVTVFAAGEYEDGVPMNSTWFTGDWNMDGEFSTQDLVLAFQDGGYVAAATAVVPEPSAMALLVCGGLLASATRRRGRRSSDAGSFTPSLLARQ